MVSGSDSWEHGAEQEDMAEAWATAMDLFQRGYEHQMEGELADAMACCCQSIEICPTAESHTLLGWVYRLIGLYGEAMGECRKAIELDPSFGNPYNDIGAYLIELERYDEAIPWLEQAIRAPCYENRAHAQYNLGRVYEHKGDWLQAIAHYKRALLVDADYRLAKVAWARLQARLN